MHLPDEEPRSAYARLKIVTGIAVALFLIALFILPALNIVSVPLIVGTGSLLAICAAVIGIQLQSNNRVARVQLERDEPEVAASITRNGNLDKVRRIAQRAACVFPIFLLLWYVSPTHFGAGWLVVSMAGSIFLLGHTVVPGSQKYVGMLILAMGAFWAAVSYVFIQAGPSLTQFTLNQFESVALLISLFLTLQYILEGIHVLSLETE